jgi:hypothetical protein
MAKVYVPSQALNPKLGINRFSGSSWTEDVGLAAGPRGSTGALSWASYVRRPITNYISEHERISDRISQRREPGRDEVPVVVTRPDEHSWSLSADRPE